MGAPRPTLTAVWLGSGASLRVDVARNHTEPVLVREGSVGGSLADALAELLASARPAPRLVLFLEAAWSQTLDLPAAAIAGLAGAEIERVLAFELEPLSGVLASTASVAFARLESPPSGHVRFRVTELGADTIAALSDAAHAARTKLVGIAHPCETVSSADPSIEVWEESTLCSRPGDVELFAARAGQRSWARSVSAWLERGAEPAVEWRGRARPDRLDLSDKLPVLHDQGDDPRGSDSALWLSAKALALLTENKDSHNSPVIAPPRRKRTRLGPFVDSLLACAAILLVGTNDYIHESRVVAALESRAASVQALRKTLDVESKREAKLVQELAAVNAEIATAEAQAQRLETAWSEQANAFPELLNALVSKRPSGVVVRTITGQERGTIDIEGIGVDAAKVNGFVADLSSALRGVGWDVKPARSVGRTASNGSTYCEFLIPIAPRASIARANEPSTRVVPSDVTSARLLRTSPPTEIQR